MQRCSLRDCESEVKNVARLIITKLMVTGRT
jgi:hypothetical protein